MHTYTIDDAEIELRAAIDAGDRTAIDTAGARLDDLEVGHQVSLLAAALWYAQQGLAVFPLTPGTKIPLRGSRGCLEATCDPDRIRAWWTTHPDANVGIATGGRVDVVDIDGPAGQKSRTQHWDDTLAQVDADNLGKVLTPRPGGMHIYVPATGDGNATNILPAIDYRGRGGYVVAPPSTTPEGTYQWLGQPRLTREEATTG